MVQCCGLLVRRDDWPERLLVIYGQVFASEIMVRFLLARLYTHQYTHSSIPACDTATVQYWYSMIL